VNALPTVILIFAVFREERGDVVYFAGFERLREGLRCRSNRGFILRPAGR